MLKETEAKSILRKQKTIDSWFLCSYGINLYRGCTHNCTYCDGRDEKYQVEGDFGTDVSIKLNAPELLERELDPARKRKPFSGGFVFVCGGVSDSYQHFEKQYGLTRRTLELLLRFGHPVHMLTKSTMIERDLQLLNQIRERSGAVVSFSFSTVDDRLGRKLEPGVPPPSRRLETVKRFKDAGFACGMYLMPAVPFITDSEELLEQTVAAAADAGVDFICFSGMTLKPGRQKDYYLDFLAAEFPALLDRTRGLYSNNNKWGAPPTEYARIVGNRFDAAASKYRIPKRMPPSLWAPLVSRDEQIILMLDQLGFLADLKGRNNPYTRAAWTLSGLRSEMLSLEKLSLEKLSLEKLSLEKLSFSELCALSGIGEFTAKIIREIAETGSSTYYNRLLTG